MFGARATRADGRPTAPPRGKLSEGRQRAGVVAEDRRAVAMAARSEVPQPDGAGRAQDQESSNDHDDPTSAIASRRRHAVAWESMFAGIHHRVTIASVA